MMKSAEIRNAFVDYFKKNGHTQVPSSPLIPENDPTLLFANSGMNQFKNTFLGLEKRNYTQAVSVQKCVRAGGKHNDLENVGFTARHHTFFEMLGNFSFGDYFKKDAIHFAWELLTKVYGIPKDKLYVTVHLTDDEAADLWHKQEGVPRDRIFRLDEDNFWRMGDTGPCGPCSEIFFDHGSEYGRETDPFKGIVAGEDRFIEIWNLVFMQFFEKSPGVMDPLPKPSVDTGAGLERMVAALQGKHNNYNTELFSPMIQTACKISGVDYVTDLKTLSQNKKISETTGALRVLADHCRSAGFLIADGALPANEGRGYVLRRIIRRALRFGRKLDETKSILPAMVETLIEHMSIAYPELKSRKEVILSTVRDEEQRFSATLDQGTLIFNEELKKAAAQNKKIISGDVVFKLYDTFGFPADLTKLMAEEHGLTIDETGFEQQMNQARTKAKSSWKGQSISADEGHLISWTQDIFKNSKATEFVGYANLETPAQIVGLSDGKSAVKSLRAGQSGFLALNQTPFYAEGGGQIGDQGEISITGTQVGVHNVTKQNEIFIHAITVNSGTVELQKSVSAKVAFSSRRNTTANHSATHLMHAALRKVLGTHVTQAGSSVDSERLRFDFTHNKPLSSEEMQKIETLVNEQIGLAHEVSAKVMPFKEATQSGALALFGEKYGDQVRVLRMGDFSCELCGGTHVSNTSQIRFFKIVSEGGVSSGVRRIEAVTGDKAIAFALHTISAFEKARQASGLVNAWQSFTDATQESKSLEHWIEDKKLEIKNLEKEIKKIQGSKISVDELVQNAVAFGQGSKFIFADVALDDRDVLAQIADHTKNKISSGIVVVIGQSEGSHPIIVSVTKDLMGTYKAGDLLKGIAAVMGGKGGGRPDFAQGAAPDRSKISEAKQQVQKDLK